MLVKDLLNRMAIDNYNNLAEDFAGYNKLNLNLDFFQFSQSNAFAAKVLDATIETFCRSTGTSLELLDLTNDEIINGAIV